MASNVFGAKQFKPTAPDKGKEKYSMMIKIAIFTSVCLKDSLSHILSFPVE